MQRFNFDFGYGKGGYGEGYYGGTALPYYLSLVTSEYQLSPKFLAWLSACLQVLDDAIPVAMNLDYSFDLDAAVGKQLDVLGEVVGVGRTLPFQPSGGASPILDDDTYRLLLRARVAWNHWDGRINSLQSIWKGLFPGGVIQVEDNQDMTINLTVSGSFSAIVLDLINNGMIVPRSEGVLVNVGQLADRPFFGFDRSDGYVAGFDVGKFT
jgi:hypothetical protein